MSSTALPASAPPPPPQVARGDFPTWLPAMLVKELRQGLRTRGFVGAFIVFQVIMALLMIGTVMGSEFGTGMTRSIMSSTITGFFWTLLGVQLLLATPARALGTLQVELDSRSLDLLVLTRLTAWRIVLGKWASLMAQALLLFVAMLPYGIVRYFMGSVDLVQDAGLCAAMIAGCGLLTAAGLACSGLPKIVRILVPIGFIMGFQVVRPLAMIMTGRSSMGSPFGSAGVGDSWVWWFNGAVGLAIFLVTAVRRIAPPAESHVALTRGLALATLLPIPVLVALSKLNDARIQVVFAAAVLSVIGAIELASMRWPMMSHWRPWAKRGVLGRVVGRLALPGWPSAFAFLVVAGLLLAVVLALPGVVRHRMPLPIEWLLVLALSGLVFPALLLSFFSGSSRNPGGYYILVLGLTCLIAALAAAAGEVTRNLNDFLEIASVFPGAGFWISAAKPAVVEEIALVIQAIVAVAVLGGAGWRSRIYWREVARINELVRAPKK